MMHYGLDFEDIAHLRSKDKSGGYNSAANMPPAMHEYIQQHNQLDVELWVLASAKLDGAIQQLPTECFQHNLAVFGKVQAAVKERCSNYKQFYAQYNLSSETLSYVSDNGIGFR